LAGAKPIFSLSCIYLVSPGARCCCCGSCGFLLLLLRAKTSPKLIIFDFLKAIAPQDELQ
jgi:hypothetical protein